ncbi:CoA-binding protein [Nitrosophilus labii]|uniref:CoA-binding protein n=1 Tax=Nitrosophilus labii TaxID=2706014 RepID=UPI00165735E4|nr:CoA-binding protein [Nitrosophilus labii]
MDCGFPTINENKESIKSIFKSVKTIAIVGLSPDPSKDSHKVAAYLQSAGYKIIPIYPKGEEILGEKVYKSLELVPDKIDMIDIFRKPAAVLPIVEIAISRGDIKVVWMQKGIVNNEAAELAHKSGIKVVQNMCTMIEHKNLFV